MASGMPDLNHLEPCPFALFKKLLNCATCLMGHSCNSESQFPRKKKQQDKENLQRGKHEKRTIMHKLTPPAKWQKKA